MSLSALTSAALVLAAQHAGGIAEANMPSSMSLYEICNAALQYFAGGGSEGYVWSWLTSTTQLSFTATTITTLARSSNVVTVSKNSHGMIAGDTITVTGSVATTDQFNGTFVIATAGANSFTYAQTGADETAGTPGSFIPAYIALPADFEAIISLRSASSIRQLMPATMDEIAIMREMSGGAGLLYYYAVSWTAQASTTTAPQARLELYPAPTAAASGVFTLSYDKAPIVMSSGASTALPDMPVFAQEALRQTVRAFAVSRVKGEQGEDWRLMEQMIQQAIRRDSMRAPISAKLRSQLYVSGSLDPDKMDNLAPTAWAP